MNLRQSGTTRRSLLTAAGAAGAATGLGMPFIRPAEAAGPIRIGVLLAKTGSIAGQAQYLWYGTQLAAAERGNKINGRPIELVWYDEPSTQGAEQNFRKLVQEEKVVAVVGGTLSSFALAEEAAAQELKIPYVCNNAAATEMTGKNCSRYTFRLNTPVNVQADMFAPFLMGYGKKWYFLTASYAFGQDIAKSFKALLKAAGGTIVGDDTVPLNTADYSAYILKIRAAKPDVVLGGLAGDLGTCLKQWNDMGMKGKIPFAEIAIGDSDVWSVGPQAATGIYTSLWWYKNPANTPAEKTMAAAHEKKYGKPAADKSWMGWLAARSLFESIEAAKSTKSMAIVEALEHWKDSGSGASYRSFDHQMLLSNLVVQVKPKITTKWDYFNVIATVPKNKADLAKVYGTEAEVGCHFPPT
ncbi:MAG: ABC transporter substrate-binding protein [Proteobacteria bacterium]|nr:ABC transporter substrate-binding protein [Pseudomonadota bacterium]